MIAAQLHSSLPAGTPCPTRRRLSEFPSSGIARVLAAPLCDLNCHCSKAFISCLVWANPPIAFALQETFLGSLATNLASQFLESIVGRTSPNSRPKSRPSGNVPRALRARQMGEIGCFSRQIRIAAGRSLAGITRTRPFSFWLIWVPFYPPDVGSSEFPVFSYQIVDFSLSTKSEYANCQEIAVRSFSSSRLFFPFGIAAATSWHGRLLFHLVDRCQPLFVFRFHLSLFDSARSCNSERN